MRNPQDIQNLRRCCEVTVAKSKNNWLYSDAAALAILRQCSAVSELVVQAMFFSHIQHLTWAATVMAAFLRFQPFTTLSLIFTLVTANALRVLTIFVPLKVLLLAGSETIPRYLQPYIAEDQRYFFIAILAAGLLALYACLVGLDMLSKALAHSGGHQALRRANEMALTSKEGVEAPRYYTKFCTIAANTIFALAGFIVLIIIHPALAAICIIGISASYGATLFLAHLWELRRPRAATRWLNENLSGYLTTVTASNLLLGLFALLALFLTDQSRGVLITFLSFLILRQSLNVIKPTIVGLKKLGEQRDAINPLVFRRYRAQSPATIAHEQELAGALSDNSRLPLLGSLVADIAEHPSQITIEWLDPSAQGVYQFAVTINRQKEQTTDRYELQVFTEKTFPLVEHEDFLFSQVNRSELNAPAVIGAAGKHSNFQSRLLALGNGARPSPKEWNDQSQQLVVDIWSVSPPQSLLRAFRTSREMLPGRVTNSLVERASIAIDHDKEAECLEQLLSRLPQLRDHLNRLPIVIHNPRILASTAWVRVDGRVLATDWTRWVLEPIGFGLPAATKDDEIEHMMSFVQARRALRRNTLKVADIRLVQAFQRLEQQASRQLYKQLFTTARQICSVFPG